eukprot:NODE_3277_length_793_cov_53.809140_g2736_i0.p4 GENE.NODE_3277_length_793_cov_53.809140_g2736_i0~~NODE_3277_length_793_cov_53.809140_g2736_i0.p4  ORF type:complete len:66 (+),score=8.36 NODE_3277_length_793_cov_53.809140_g2736_i0:382-579(+)
MSKPDSTIVSVDLGRMAGLLGVSENDLVDALAPNIGDVPTAGNKDEYIHWCRSKNQPPFGSLFYK